MTQWPLLSIHCCSASTIAALVAAVVTSPFDVVKTRLMNQKKGGEAYASAFQSVVKVILSEIVQENSNTAKIARTEGIGGFYKGFLPYFLRLGPQTILTFVFFEQFAKIFRYFNAKFGKA